VLALIEIAKQEDGARCIAERREQIIQQILARVERDRERRRFRRAFAAGAVTAVLVVLALGLIRVGASRLAHPSPELAGKTFGQRVVTE